MGNSTWARSNFLPSMDGFDSVENMDGSKNLSFGLCSNVSVFGIHFWSVFEREIRRVAVLLQVLP